MADVIRALDAEDVPNLVRVARGAYPGAGRSAQEWEAIFRRNMAEESQPGYYGLFREGRLLGCMRHFDFRLRLYESEVLCGGVGMVAVDLLHKKEHVARALLDFYLRHYYERGAPLAALYPFRPDFYRQMGFGYGTKTAQYRIKPADLPRGPSKAHLVELGPQDGPAMLESYQRLAARTHGLFQRNPSWHVRLFEDGGLRAIGYRTGSRLEGYLLYHFRSGTSFLQNALEVRELIYEHPAALAELLTFLHTQFDQVHQVIINTQDEQFHQLLRDPRNGSDNLIPILAQESHASGLGIMYRLLDLEAFFAALQEHNFGDQSCVVRLVVDDGFLHHAPQVVTLAVERGRAGLQPGATPEVELRLGVAEASSLLMGSADLRSLLRLGLAEISNPAYSGTVHRLFLAEEKPLCLTAF